MNKSIKNFLIIIILLVLGLFISPNTVNATSHSSEFIKITESSYAYSDEDVRIFDPYFYKQNQMLYLKITNLSNEELTVHLTIDYYDAKYNKIARSTISEELSNNSGFDVISVYLSDSDYLINPNIQQGIEYYKINYYTVKDNAEISNSNEDSSVVDNYFEKPSQNYYYNDYDYVIDNYNVDIKVNENNTYDITETIGAYFNVAKHGIFRTIPLTNTVRRLDGTTNKNRAKISNLQVSDEYTTSKENGNYKIKIGSYSTVLTGKKEYVIGYNYNIGKDRSDNYDELYFNIIGTEWDTVIGNVTFTITMPKQFDKDKLGFSAGKLASIDSSKITYSVDGNVIKGSYNGVLTPGEALTVRAELPEGYFVNSGYKTDLYTYLFFLIPTFGLIIAFLLWYKFGKDEQVIETVEFYPPEGFNSLEIGYLYKGKATNEDVTSLLVYLANKGYIKIREKEANSLFGSTNGFEIVKLKDYDGNNANEREFLEGLFEKYRYSESKLINEMPTVTQHDLYDRFYRTMNRILKSINSKTNKNKIFEKATSFKSVIIILMTIISLLTIIAVPTLEYAGIGELGITLMITLFYVPFYAVGLSGGMPKVFRIFWLGFTIFHSSIFFSTMPIMSAIKEESIFLIGFLFGVACIIGMIVCLKAMPKRTKYGNEILGKIKGFKTFLETAEKEKLEAMVMQEPSYFYDILPFTYVLGVSEKWINKFETISLQAPDWYYSSSGFDVGSFGTFMNSTMSSAQSAMSSSPSSSSGGSSFGGSSSGGGSSGGGSGGGGGGSW